MSCYKKNNNFTLSNPHLRRIAWAVLFFMALFALSLALSKQGLNTDLAIREQPPSLEHIFGTDTLGRDMLTRTIYGLIVSLKVGILASVASALIALTLGLAAAVLGRWADVTVTWLVDTFMALPHLVLLILISFAVGGGEKGVLIAVALSHWPALTRVIRAEALQLKSAPYIILAKKLGQSPWKVATRHFLPQLLPQFIIGLLLLFPHVILHEAALSFLGFGLNPHTPAVGILLAEALRYLSTGFWWMGILPGFCLLITVKMFDTFGMGVKNYFTPHQD